MKIVIKSDFKKKIPFKQRQPVLNKIGVYLSGSIKRRTEFKNVDPQGKPFKAYSKKYADYKNREGGSGSIVNLKSVLPVSSHMVNSVNVVNVNNNFVEVGVTGFNEDKALYNEAMGREFLGISKEDDKKIDQILDKYITDELNKKL